MGLHLDEMGSSHHELDSIFIPLANANTAASLDEGDEITIIIKGKVMGSVARKGDAAEFEDPGTVRVMPSSIKIDGRNEFTDLAED